jgi:hypothetical protein
MQWQMLFGYSLTLCFTGPGQKAIWIDQVVLWCMVGGICAGVYFSGSEWRCPLDTYNCLVDLNAVDVGKPRGDKEVEASEYGGGAGGLEQVISEVGLHTGGLCACQGCCTVEGGLQGRRWSRGGELAT